MKLYTDFASFAKTKIFESDYFKDVKSSGKFGEIETGLEIETTPIDVVYDIPNDILSDIIDKLKAEPSNVMDFDSMSRDVIAKKIANVILAKYLKADNIDIIDLQGEEEEDERSYDFTGKLPTLDMDMELKENMENEMVGMEDDLEMDGTEITKFSDFSKDEYKEGCGLECEDEVEILRNEFDASEEEIEDFKIKFEEGEVTSASEYADMFMYEDDEDEFGDDEDGSFEEEEEETDIVSHEIEKEQEFDISTEEMKESSSLKSFDDFIKSKKK